MYHASNLGDYAPIEFADLYGYIPEEGDKPEDFCYEYQDVFVADFDAAGNGYEGFAAEQWAEHVAAAVAATKEAERLLAKWREENV